MPEFVYLATSSNVNAVKVGYWTNSEKMLLSRYKTYYGAKTQLWVFRCNFTSPAAKIEAAFKQKFAGKRESMELYKKTTENMQLYLDFLYDACEDVEKIGKHDEELEDDEHRKKLDQVTAELCIAKQALEEMKRKQDNSDIVIDKNNAIAELRTSNRDLVNRQQEKIQLQRYVIDKLLAYIQHDMAAPAIIVEFATKLTDVI